MTLNKYQFVKVTRRVAVLTGDAVYGVVNEIERIRTNVILDNNVISAGDSGGAGHREIWPLSGVDPEGT